jgi:phosphoserine phosphatase
MKDIRLAAFDMDGTILREDSSWAALHRYFKTTERENESLKLYTAGEIHYEEFMRRDISCWPQNLHISEIERVLSNYKIRDEAYTTIERLRQKGVKTALITAGIDILAKEVARDLGMEIWVANGLKVDNAGRLTGEGIGNVDPSRKDIAFTNLLSKLGIKSESTIAVGDTVYDLSFLKAAGIGFFLSNENDVTLNEGIIRIQRLSEIFAYMHENEESESTRLHNVGSNKLR